MNELKCPNCGKVFTVDETGYARILKQVRDDEFKKELASREQAGLKLAKMEMEKEQSLKAAEFEQEIIKRDQKIHELMHEIEKADTKRELAITKAVQERDGQIIKLQSDIELQKQKELSSRNQLIAIHKEEIRIRDEEIETWKNYRESQKTKNVGEDLEQYCLNEFNRIRMTAFPNAFFEKDNEVSSSGSKGDFIYREQSDGVEFISIMFDMKNEQDSTKTKHKNEHFFKELDKDRREKGCEYAVLVSMLERDNDYYNDGIVQVYNYDKMYVVRPQFFLQIIGLLRNNALNTVEYKKQLEELKSRQIDIVHFEDNLAAAKEDFTKSVSQAGVNYDKAIKEIDTAIANLEKTKTALMTSMKFLNAAGNKLDKVTIKKLTKDAPSVRAMFEEDFKVHQEPVNSRI